MTDTMTEPETRRVKRPPAHPCGWCAPAQGHRQRQCRGAYRNAVPASVAPDRLWHCPCADAGHPGRQAP